MSSFAQTLSTVTWNDPAPNTTSFDVQSHHFGNRYADRSLSGPEYTKGWIMSEKE
jgi:hypothetical protein